MHRTSKWRVGVMICEHYIVDVESWSEAEAIELTYHKIQNNPEDYIMTANQNITSIFINDKESRGFVPFVSDYMSEDNEIED
jgi:hypothetical protein